MIPTREHDVQNSIRIAISSTGTGVSFRCNVGEAWTGDVTNNLDGSVTIKNPRRFQSGLPVGFSDLFVVIPTIITPDMIGRKIAISGFIEVKNEKGRLRPEQKNFLSQMQSLGARAGVARSPEEAIKILRGGGDPIDP